MMQIFVRADKETLTIPVEKETTINAIKVEIERKTGFPVVSHVLSFAGKVLAGTNTLQDYDIHDEATLILVRRCRGGEDIFQLEVRDAGTSGSFFLEVTKTTTIQDLEDQIIRYRRKRVNKLKIIYSGKRITKGTLEENKITEECTIVIVAGYQGGCFVPVLFRKRFRLSY